VTATDNGGAVATDGPTAIVGRCKDAAAAFPVSYPTAGSSR